MNQKQKQVLDNPPANWADPNGGDVPNAKADRLSWEVEVRRGLADKAKLQVDLLGPRIERLRHMLRQAQARALSFPGEDMVAREREKSLGVLVPALEKWQAFLKACTPWVGCRGKALHRAVQAAEAAEVTAEAPVLELEAARRVIGGLASAAGLDAKEVDSAFSGIGKVFRERLAVAREAAAAARQERDENAAAITDLEAQIDRLRARKTAAA